MGLSSHRRVHFATKGVVARTNACRASGSIIASPLAGRDYKAAIWRSGPLARAMNTATWLNRPPIAVYSALANATQRPTGAQITKCIDLRTVVRALRPSPNTLISTVRLRDPRRAAKEIGQSGGWGVIADLHHANPIENNPRALGVPRGRASAPWHDPTISTYSLRGHQSLKASQSNLKLGAACSSC